MTIEERLGNMERELGRVKRRNRWLLGAILLVAGGLAVPVVLETTALRARAQAAGTAKEIRASSFVLVDENGKTRGGLVFNHNGWPTLELWDENGLGRAALFVSKDGPGLALRDENGKNRLAMILVKDAPGLLLYDENGKVRANLIFLNNRPMLELNDKNGKVIWSALK